MNTRWTVIVGALSALGLAACFPMPVPQPPNPTPAESFVVPRTCSGYVALTFDDGPTPPSAGLPSNVRLLVAALKRTGLRGIFFNVGRAATPGWGNDRSDYLGLERTVGIVENHTWAHQNQITLTDAQITENLARTTAAIGRPAPRYFRPPFGATNPKVEAAAKSLGLTQVMWTIDTLDYRRIPAAAIAATVAKAKDGDIVLMHDWSHAPEALPAIATDMYRRGLCAGGIVPTSPTPLPADVVATISRAGSTVTSQSVKAGAWTDIP